MLLFLQLIFTLYYCRTDCCLLGYRDLAISKEHKTRLRVSQLSVYTLFSSLLSGNEHSSPESNQVHLKCTPVILPQLGYWYQRFSDGNPRLMGTISVFWIWHTVFSLCKCHCYKAHLEELESQPTWCSREIRLWFQVCALGWHDAPHLSVSFIHLSNLRPCPIICGH